MGVLIFSLADTVPSEISSDRVKQELEKYGFRVWDIKHISEEESEKCKDFIVAELWKNRSKLHNEARIKTLIIAYDLAVTPPTFTQKNLYPGIDNARLLLFAYHFKNQLSSNKADLLEGGMLRSTINDVTSRQCLSKLWPDLISVLDNVIRDDLRCLSSTFTVLKDLTPTGCYSKVYLIDYDGQLAVEKLYRPECSKKFEKEKTAYLELSDMVDGVPNALFIGENSLILPYINESLKFEPSDCKLVPLKSIRPIIHTLKQIYDAGYAVIDCHSGNCLFESALEVWLIDFEFLYKYKSYPASFLESYDIDGVPDDFDGDIPPGFPGYLKHPWVNEFGVTPRFALEHGDIQIRFRRAIFWLRQVCPIFVYRKIRSGLRFGLALTNLLLRKSGLFSGRRIYIRMRP